MESNELGWLIRDLSNVIRGPYTHAEILQLIKKGQLKGKTEIARANAYWFGMDEKAEVAKFFPELGIKAPESETQMTATLTQADASEGSGEGVEITQFTAAPTRAELAKSQKADSPGAAPSVASSGAKMEWLSDEFAEEFASLEMDSAPTPPAGSEVAKGSPLERATVKADTLPSELKTAKGERPKPINTLLKSPEPKGTAIPGPSQNLVNVPVVEPDTGKILLPEEEERLAEAQRAKRKFVLFGCVTLAIIGTLGYFAMSSGVAEKKVPRREQGRTIENPEEELKNSLLLFDLEGVKASINELELRMRGDPILPMAKAILKKEFLFDSDGASIALQTARTLSQEPKLSAEIENLMGVYGFDRDPLASISTLKKVVEENPSDAVFRFNLAMALFRSGKYQDANSVVTSLMSGLRGDDELSHDAAMIAGWSRDLASRGNDANAESAFLKALELKPGSAYARLGLAIHRLRKFGLKEAESDFRQFIDLVPDLESPSRIVNYRKMAAFEIYNLARREIRELNMPGGVVGPRPSPLIMAADAMLSSLQSRTGEAGKILEGALSNAPGDPNILKAVAYVRWRDGRYDDVIDLLGELNKEKNSFAVNFLLAKAYLKTGKIALAEKHFVTLTTIASSRSEGWSGQGEIQLLQNNSELAKRHFSTALNRESRDLVALKGLERLGEDPQNIVRGFENLLPFIR